MLQANARGAQGIDFFVALVRFLRMLRIFCLFQLGRRVTSEINSRLMTLVCTLLSLIMISASLFLEIETSYGVSTWGHPEVGFGSVLGGGLWWPVGGLRGGF